MIPMKKLGNFLIGKRQNKSMADVDDTITDFLKTGRLGPLQLGMTRSMIVDAVGEPDDVGYTRRRDPYNNCILLFGDTGKVNLQLFLNAGMLTGIWFYFRGSDDKSSLPHWTNSKTCPLRGSTTLNDFFSLADQANLPWSLYPQLIDEEQTAFILTDTQIKLIWEHDPDSLYSVSLTGHE